MKYLIEIESNSTGKTYTRTSDKREFSEDEKIKIICEITGYLEPDEVDLERFQFYITEISKIKKI